MAICTRDAVCRAPVPSNRHFGVKILRIIAAAVHINTVTKLFDSGATIVSIHSGQPDQRTVIAFCGEHALPDLRTRPQAGHPDQKVARTPTVTPIGAAGL